MPRNFSPSITVRLTALYSIASGIILLILGLLLYGYTAHSVEERSAQYISDEVREVLDLLSRPDAEAALKNEMLLEQRNRTHVVHLLRVLDAEGRTLAEDPEMHRLLPASFFPAAALLDSAAYRGIKRRVPDGNTYELRAVRAVIRGFGGKGRVVQIGMDVTRNNTFLMGLREVIAFAILFGMAITALIGAGIVRTSLRPLATITGYMEQVSARRLHERIGTKVWPPELASVADAFDAMLDRLEQSFDALSDYTGNLAHELRTPINSLMIEADIALMRTRTPEEYQKVIGSSMEEYERLSCIVDSLLFLARADNTAHLLRKHTVEVGKEVERICDFYMPVAADSGVRLSSSGQGTLLLDRDLFDKAVGNLISNALQYTPAGGEVKVSVRERDETVVEVAVSDTGCGIDEEHLPRIFDRFYRGSSEQRRDPQGSGLGLAIVKAIVAMHEGTIEVESRVSQGTTVSLLFNKEAKDAAEAVTGIVSPLP